MLFFKIHWIIFSWFVQEIFCLDQTCTFGTGMPDYTKMDEIPTKSYYYCAIKDAKLLDENEPVNTITKDNTKSNSEVQLVSYVSGNNVKFIPNSLFKTFPNMKYFCFSNTEGINVLKPHFLTGAKNLKVFYIHGNYLTSLDKDLFIEAPNLEHINLKKNLIESVHISTFKGLSNLEGLYLQGNKIVSLHPNTFSKLRKLKSLNLQSNECINTSFAILETSHTIIATEIIKTCKNDDLSLISSLINTKFDKLNDDFKVAKFNDHVLNSQRNFQFHILIGLFSSVAFILTVLGVVGIAIIIKNILRKHKLPKNEPGNDIELD